MLLDQESLTSQRINFVFRYNSVLRLIFFHPISLRKCVGHFKDVYVQFETYQIKKKFFFYIWNPDLYIFIIYGRISLCVFIFYALSCQDSYLLH